MTLTEGLVESPRVYLVARSRDYHDIVTGKLDGITAVMTGKLKIDGDMNFMKGFGKMFEPLGTGEAVKKTLWQRLMLIGSVIKYLVSKPFSKRN